MLLSPAPPKIFTRGAGGRRGPRAPGSGRAAFPPGARQPHLLGTAAAEPGARSRSPEPGPVPCEGLAASGRALEDLGFRKRSSMSSFKRRYQRPAARRRDGAEGGLAHFVFLCTPFPLRQNQTELSLLPRRTAVRYFSTLDYEHFQTYRKLKEFYSERFTFSFSLF